MAATAEYAVLEPKRQRFNVGQTGVARPNGEDQDGRVAQLERPVSPNQFANQWPNPTLPASTQNPEHVPLGNGAAAQGRTSLLFAAGAAAKLPFSGPYEAIGRGFIRGRLQTKPLARKPLFFDIDVAGQAWYASDLELRRGANSRPPLRVRALLARYGTQYGFQGSLGRLRYAATGLGQLDGIRLQVPIAGNLTLSGFGGAVPAALDGSPDTQTTRFGAELTYDAYDTALRPRVSLTAHGSTFGGQLDERRLRLQADFHPQAGYFGGYGLLSQFDAGNPWNAPENELTAAGVYGGIRFWDVVHTSFQVDMQRPERSLWLASFVPASWLCITSPLPGNQPEQCRGDETRYRAQGTLGLHFTDWAIALGGSAMSTTGADASQGGGFLHLRLNKFLGDSGHLDVTASGSDGSLYQTAAVAIAPGVTLSRSFDVTLRYRPAVSRYYSDVDFFLEHNAGGSIRYTPSHRFEMHLDADLLTSRDVDVVLVQLLTTWRPI